MALVIARRADGFKGDGKPEPSPADGLGFLTQSAPQRTPWVCWDPLHCGVRSDHGSMPPCLPSCDLLIAGVIGPGMIGAEPAPLPFKPSPVPGGVAVIAIPGKGAAPGVTYRGEPVLVRRSVRGWQAVVGIPLSAKPGQDAIEVGGHAVPFTIKPKRYPEQRITLKDQRKVTPNAEDEARIAREQALMAPAWKAWPEGLIPTLGFQRPVPGGLTASFGMRRIFNGEPRSPHSGLDIRPPRASLCGRRPRAWWCYGRLLL